MILQDDNFVLSAIFCAIEEDNKTGLEELLNVANIDINQTNKHGESGVHIAAGLGRLEMLRVLAGHGANLGQVDTQGDSAVYWAARQGHAQAIQYLVEQGVHVNQQNKVILLNPNYIHTLLIFIWYCMSYSHLNTNIKCFVRYLFVSF